MAFNWLSLVLGVFYIVLGIVVIIKKWFAFPLDVNVAFAAGGVMVLYGIFRIIRAIYRIKNNNNEA